MFLLVRYIDILMHIIISANGGHSNLPSEISLRTEWNFLCSGSWNQKFLLHNYVFICTQFFHALTIFCPNITFSETKITTKILRFHHNALKMGSCTFLPNCIYSDTGNSMTAASKLCWSETGRGSKRLITTTTKFKINTAKSL